MLGMRTDLTCWYVDLADSSYVLLHRFNRSFELRRPIGYGESLISGVGDPGVSDMFPSHSAASS